MSENKTKATDASVEAFLNTIDNDSKREDAFEILKLMEKVSKEKPKMWGGSIIGFGEYHYKYESGREGDFMRIGFSPRKSNFSLYIMPGFSNYDELMEKLGKYKTGKSCLYINKLADVDKKVLEKLMRESLKSMKKMYPN